MRIDKYIVSVGLLSRTECSKACKAGRIKVNDEIVKDSSKHINENTDKVELDNQLVEYKKYTYIMLNKPAGYISATDDPREKTVLELLPPNLRKIGLFPCGRLDKDTTGLLILTNDGQTAHYVISPKHHAEKIYSFTTKKPVSTIDISKIEPGIELEDGYLTMPCKINMDSDVQGQITIVEGKFHQIKRMFEAVENKIIQLERISFAGIKIDRSLELGQWRYLTKEEENLLLEKNKSI